MRLALLIILFVVNIHHGCFEKTCKKGQSYSKTRDLLFQTQTASFECTSTEETHTSTRSSPFQGSYSPEDTTLPCCYNGECTFMEMRTVLENQLLETRLLPQVRPAVEECPGCHICASTNPSWAKEDIPDLGLWRMGQLGGWTLEENAESKYTQGTETHKSAQIPCQGKKQRKRQDRRNGERTTACWKRSKHCGAYTLLVIAFTQPNIEFSQFTPHSCRNEAYGVDGCIEEWRPAIVTTGSGHFGRSSKEHCTGRIEKYPRSSIQSLPGEEAISRSKGSSRSIACGLAPTHCRFTGKMEDVCGRVPGAGHDCQWSGRNGHRDLETSQRAPGGSQTVHHVEGRAHGNLRYRGSCREDRIKYSDSGGHECHDREPEFTEEKIRSSGRGTAHQKAETARCPRQTGNKSHGAFWGGREVDFSETFQGPKGTIAVSNCVLRWQHSVCRCPGFLSKWTAIEHATDLAKEFGHRSQPRTKALLSQGKHSRSKERNRSSTFPTVTFNSEIQIYIESSGKSPTMVIPHDALQNWIDKPWKLDLNEEHMRPSFTFKVVEETPHGQGLPRPEGGEQGQLIDGVRIDRTQLHHAPDWIRDGWNRFLLRARVHRRGEGPRAYTRTWYLHHDHVLSWNVWREFELHEYPQDWHGDICRLWRDQIHDDAAVHIAWIDPEVPPIPGWESHLGDIIVWQSPRPDRKCVLFLTWTQSDMHDRLRLQALSVPSRQTRPDIFRRNDLMFTCWNHQCDIIRGARTFHDGIIDHTDCSGILLQVDLTSHEQSTATDETQFIQLSIKNQVQTAGSTSELILRDITNCNTGPTVCPNSIEGQEGAPSSTGKAPLPKPKPLFWITPPWQQRLQDQLEQARVALPAIEDEDGRPTIATWFLDHRHILRNEHQRELRLPRDPRQWRHAILDLWQDLRTPGIGYKLDTVTPRPHMRDPHIVADVILSQNTFPATVSAMVNLVQYDHDPIIVVPIAVVIPIIVDTAIIIDAGDTSHICPPADNTRRCEIWAGGFQLQPNTNYPGLAGMCHDIYLAAVDTNAIVPPNIYDTGDATTGEDATNLMQRSVKKRSAESSNEHAEHASTSIANDTHDEQNEEEFVIHEDRNVEDTEADIDQMPPEEDPPHTQDVDSLQSSLLYVVNDRERHAHLRWNSHPALLRSVANVLELSIHEIIDLYDLQYRPHGIPTDSYPMVVHRVGDIPVGTLHKIVVIDVIVQDNDDSEVTDRRTVVVPAILTTDRTLTLARVDRYCHHVPTTCTLQHNGRRWTQHDLPINVAHGDYIQIQVPPWRIEPVLTAQAIWQLQSGQTVPTGDIREPPNDRNEEPASESESESFAGEELQVPEIHDNLLIADEEFEDDLLRSWGDSSAIESEELGPVAYYAVWYVSGRTMHRCNRARQIGLLQEPQTWLRRLADLWRDIIDPVAAMDYYFVFPEPPASIMERHLAGHIILAQHLHEHQRAVHMTVIRADLRDSPHITWAMICPRWANKAMIYGWHLVQAVCPPMLARNKCTCKTGDREIHDGDDVRLYDGQSIYTLVERASRATDPDAAQGHSLVETASQWRRRDPDQPADTPNDQTGGPGVMEWSPETYQQGPTQISLHELLQQDDRTCIVKLIQGGHFERFPPFVEVPYWFDNQVIRDELACWGHHCQVIQMGNHEVAFCLPKDWQANAHHYHYLYVNQDTSDGHGAFAHTATSEWIDFDHMKLLHACGYCRAAIVKNANIQDKLNMIVFENVQAEVAPKPQRQRQCSPWPPRQPHNWTKIPVSDRFSNLPKDDRPFKLRMRQPISEFQKLLCSSHQTLCTDVDYLELEEPLKAYISTVPVQNDITDLDRLIIYTDGSSMSKLRQTIPDRGDDPNSGVDTWAFVVIGEKYPCDGQAGQIRLIGWHAQPVIYDSDRPHHLGSLRLGSEIAEREAMCWAMFWRLGLDSHIPTCFRPDNLTTAGQAQGKFGTHATDDSFKCLRGLYQALECILPDEHLRIDHVRSHAGEPWNEMVDCIAKQEARKGFYLNRQDIDLRLWLKDIPFIWTLLATQDGLPTLAHDGHVPTAPELPVVKSQNPVQHAAWKKTVVSLSIASGNVGSLFIGPDGHGGKINYLRTQMKSFALNFIGIQEARSPPGLSTTDNVMRIAGGAQGHLYGNELWVNLDQPFGFSGTKPLFFQKQNFTVVHTEPRLMLVHAVHDAFSAWFLVAHAPHSGRPQEERDSWWVNAADAVRPFLNDEPVFLCIDANATTGKADDIHIGFREDTTSANSEGFRTFLTDLGLCLPSTMEVHVGSDETWVSPGGQFAKRIDYVAIPCCLKEHCVHSQVVEDFDLGQQYDHSLVAIEMKWTDHIPMYARSQSEKTHHKRLMLPEIREIPDQRLANITASPWQCDIGTQVDTFNAEVHATLDKQKGQDATTYKKPYLDDEIWKLRKTKLQRKKALKDARKHHKLALLRSVFQAWQGDPDAVLPNDDLTQIRQLTLVVKLQQTSRDLKFRLRTAKQNALKATIESLPPQCAASDVLRTVRPFIGPTNPKKAKRQALPMVKNADGSVCTSPSDAMNRWIEHFMTMEGGKRLQSEDQQILWIENLRRLRADDLDLCWDQLPSLTDLEDACRQVALAKATGPDGIQSDFIHTHPCVTAKKLYPVLLKLLLHGQEALIHKGGRLAVAYKGKGNHDTCESYRSLLVSSHPGKAIHKALRSSCTSIFAQFMQRQQLGGRRHGPVSLAVHLTRSYLRANQRQGRSVGILFLDLKEAFYRIVRGIVVDVSEEDEMLAHLAARLELPPDALHELHGLLADDCALLQAGMTPHYRKAVSALHSDTHFHLNGQLDSCRTQVGTRPGDSWADVIFSFAWARLLRGLEKDLTDRCIIDAFPYAGTWSPFGSSTSDHGEDVPFIGPTWMDDLSLVVSGSTPAEAESRIGQAAGLLLDRCAQFGMTPNLAKGKTEVLFKFCGAGSKKLRARYYGELNATLPIICQHGIAHINIVGDYTHLGNVIHHTGSHRKEMTRRLGIAHQAYTQHSRVLYRNRAIPFPKRKELFESLIVTKLLYGSETWAFGTIKEQERLHAGIMRLYRRLCQCRHDAALTDEDILCQGDLLSPTELLRRQRLRYLPTLYKCADLVPWTLLEADADWCDLMRADLEWLHLQLCNASNLPDPQLDFVPWKKLIVHYPGYWKRLVRRGFAHAVQQRKREHDVRQFHVDIIDMLGAHGSFAHDLPAKPRSFGDTFFGCLHCSLRCKSLGGEGAHMFKKHGKHAFHRRYCGGTQRSACLKEYHTIGRLSHHLRTSRKCRQLLAGRRAHFDPDHGEGSSVHAAQEYEHNQTKVVQQAAGPLLPCRPQEETVEIHQQCFTEACEFLLRLGKDEFIQACIELPQHHAISWTLWTATFRALQHTVTAEDQEFLSMQPVELDQAIDTLCRPSTWSMFHQHAHDTTSSHSHMDLYDLEGWMISLLRSHAEAWRSATSIPRRWFCEKIVLHAFSGRRRRGDLQEFMENVQTKHPATVLITVSLDIIVNQQWGDVRSVETKTFWLSGIRDGYIVAMLAGPPCNTWSAARGRELADRQGPRVIRHEDTAWGDLSLRLRELCDICVGNDLLGFALTAFVLLFLTDGFAIIEHPDEPEDLKAVSIWRLPLVMLLRSFPGVHLHKVLQGLFGAESPKPTGFLTLNLPNFTHTMHRWRLVNNPPSGCSIGVTTDGVFCTARLKEYPPALCGGLAQCLMTAICTDEAVDVESHVPAHFLTQCQKMVCTEYGHHLGPDFAGT